MTLTAFANPAQPAMRSAFGIAAAETMTNIGLTGINATKIDLTNGNLVIDLSGLGEEETASLITSLRNGESILPESLMSAAGGENLHSFELIKNAVTNVDSALEMMTLISEDLNENLGFVVPSGTPTVVGDRVVWSATVPEPATLLMFSLGLAGLGLARRRK